jgi:hypothetical protein
MYWQKIVPISAVATPVLTQANKLSTWATIPVSCIFAPAHKCKRQKELSGQCTGGAVIYPDGSVEAEGLCAVTDVGGDVLTYAFTQGRGAREGKYTRKGGTGKFTNSRETGWFQALSLNGDVTTGNWGGKGACK